MGLLLTILAVILFVVGVVQIVKGAVVWGIALIVLALLVGPGGYSIWR